MLTSTEIALVILAARDNAFIHNQRDGQSFFNILSSTHPEEATMLNGIPNIDPFYDDDFLAAAIKTIYKY